MKILRTIIIFALCLLPINCDVAEGVLDSEMCKSLDYCRLKFGNASQDSLKVLIDGEEKCILGSRNSI